MKYLHVIVFGSALAVLFMNQFLLALGSCLNPVSLQLQNNLSAALDDLGCGNFCLPNVAAGTGNECNHCTRILNTLESQTCHDSALSSSQFGVCCEYAQNAQVLGAGVQDVCGYNLDTGGSTPTVGYIQCHQSAPVAAPTPPTPQGSAANQNFSYRPYSLVFVLLSMLYITR
mmetsp:Transcript_21449/g.27407  ORF Transcript_21449/g.27407 Transcript_21449/m.27407 type:complete len:172 (+) Transcript_21449:262-777(+)